MKKQHRRGTRAFLKDQGFVFDKKPHQINRILLKSLSDQRRTQLENIWNMRNAGLANGLEQYTIPQTIKQAAMLFSYDWPRTIASFEWLDGIISKIHPAKTIEMGMGAGFLVKFLAERHPELEFQGIDAEKNLVEIGSELCGKALISGDYCVVEPDQKYELIVCNFGFDLDNFEESTTPHGTAECEGQVYCPGCSDDMKSQLDNYLSAWRSWGSDYSSIAIVGRISNFGILRALVLAAEGVGWNVNLSLSKMLEVEGITKEMESFPALLFQPSLISPGSVPLEKIADYFGAH